MIILRGEISLCFKLVFILLSIHKLHKVLFNGDMQLMQIQMITTLME